MSPQAAAELLISPFSIAFLVAVAGLSTWILRAFSRRAPSSIRVSRILSGYAAVIVVMFVVGWFFDFFSVDKSWTSSVFLAYFAALAMAVFGLPIVGVLLAIGRGSVPWCLLASLGIALLLTVAYFALGDLSARSPAAWASQISLFATLSFLAMLAFCLGARIPWRRRTL